MARLQLDRCLTWVMLGVLLLHQPRQRVQSRALLDKSGNIDLRAQVIAYDASRIIERSHHEEIDKGRAVAAIVEESLAVFLAGLELLSDSLHTEWIRLGALEEPTVTPYRVVHAVLCRSVEFWFHHHTVSFVPSR